MKIGLIGASGYTGQELLRLLASHPEAQVTVVTSRQDKGRALTELFPSLLGLGRYDRLILTDPADQALATKAELFFTAVPHGAAMDIVPGLLRDGAKVIDLSADFRMRSQAVYEAWYQEHRAANLLDEAVYGLPELYAHQIKQARLTANPGCYATSVILGLAPLVKAGLLAAAPIIADAKSGVTGAGRGASLNTSFCEVSDSFKAYKITGHRHTPEIEQELSFLAGAPATVSFTPHLLPLNRGILTTIYVRPLNEATDWATLNEVYQDFYRSAPFIRLRPEGFEPQTSDVRGSNFCDLAWFKDQRAGLLKIVAVLDNLCRGASGQAVANFNLMSGLPETLGLSQFGLRP